MPGVVAVVHHTRYMMCATEAIARVLALVRARTELYCVRVAVWLGAVIL